MAPRAPQSRRRRRRSPHAHYPGAHGAFARFGHDSVGVVLVFAPWLLAGANVETAMAIAMLAASALAIAAIARARVGSELPRPPLLATFLLGLGFTAFQLVPWPVAITRFLSPRVVEATRLSYEAVGLHPPTLVPTSFDPGATLRELVNGTMLVAILVAASALRERRGRTHVMRYVAASVLGVAFVSIAHRILTPSAVFGLYTPVRAAVTGPILNTNQLAGFMALGVPLLLGFAAETREAGVRVAWSAGAVVLVVVAFLTHSRGGAAATVAGPVLFGILLATAPLGAKQAKGTRRVVASLVAFLVVATVAFLFVVDGDVPADFHDTDISKLELIKAGLAVALENPLVGVGRGAFSSAFVTGQSGDYERYTHPENIVAQWTAEWGIPVALLIAAGLFRFLARAVSHARSRVHLGAVAGIVAITLQNLVDFGLEMPGIACVAVGLLAALEPGVRSADRGASTGAREPAAPRFLATRDRGFAVLVVGVFALSTFVIDIDATRTVSLLSSRSYTRAELTEIGHRAARFHPSEPALFLLLGAYGISAGYPYAMRCLNRTMELAPGWAQTHAIAAVWLYEHRRFDQARIEVRESASRSASWASPIACALIAERPDRESLFAMAPRSGRARIAFLGSVVSCPGLASDIVESIDAIVLGDPAPPTPVLLREAARRVARRDAPGARAIADRLVRANPRASDGYIVTADTRILVGDVDGALRTLRAAESRVDDPRALLTHAARLATGNRRANEMRDVLVRLRALDGGSGALQARDLMLLGQLEAELGNHGNAMSAYRDADTIDPSTGGLAAAASVADRIGSPSLAAELYGVVCARGEAGSAACRQHEAIRTRMNAAAAAVATP